MTAGKIQACGTVQALREQMALPLRIDIRVDTEHLDTVRTVLGQLPVSAIEAHAGHIALQCRREAKMAVIEALAQDGRVRDLTVREPSLEDVFFGFSD
jgi:Cu-processing system ATP-binding protein